MKNIIKLFLSIIICELVGISGSLATIPAIGTWYQEINKPFFNPPNWIFGPVWTILYFLMGVSFYLIWQKGINKNTQKAVMFFALQLFLNFLWTFLFFGARMFYLAFIEIVMLWVAIVLTIINFKKISPKAAYLLIPYPVWVTFASLLNLSIAILN